MTRILWRMAASSSERTLGRAGMGEISVLAGQVNHTSTHHDLSM
jgi:hypothetical protein